MPFGNEPLAQLLITLKEQNKSLIREIEDLRIKLEDAEGKLLASQFGLLILQCASDRCVTLAWLLAPEPVALLYEVEVTGDLYSTFKASRK